VVTLIGSDLLSDTVLVGMDEARRLGCPLWLVHVVDSTKVPECLWELVAAPDQRLTAGWERLSFAADRVVAAGFSRHQVRLEVRTGTVSGYFRELDPERDLVVLGGRVPRVATDVRLAYFRPGVELLRAWIVLRLGVKPATLNNRR
jgi:nucleotide-binding universal stress UspA family protein